MVVGRAAGEHPPGMPTRLLAIDLPPLLRDLLRGALVRHNVAQGRTDEAIFVDLGDGGGDVEALAAVTHADVVITPLQAGAWPASCAPMIERRDGLRLYGIGTQDGDAQLTQMRAVELREEELRLGRLTMDELLDRAVGDAA